MQGRVLSFRTDKGFGWIAPDDGDRDVFIHERQLAAVGLNTLFVGQRVEFDLKEGRDGKMSAENIRVVETAK